MLPKSTAPCTPTCVSHESTPLHRGRHTLRRPHRLLNLSPRTLLLLAVLSSTYSRGQDSTIRVTLVRPAESLRTHQRDNAVKNRWANHEPFPGDPLRAIDTDRLLHAIASVESGLNDNAVGRRGERGRYQIRPATWRSFSREPFSYAHYPGPARQCALAYLRCLARTLLDHNRIPNVYDLAILWNTGTLLTRSSDYATRVTALYNASSPQTPVSPPLFVPPGSHR